MKEKVQRCIIPGCGTKGDDGQRQPRIATIGLVCDRCLDRHLEQLREIVDLYALLPDMIDPSTGEQATGPKVSGTPDPPANARLDVIAMLDPRSRARVAGDDDGNDLIDTLGVLAQWVRLAREERNLPTPTTRPTVTSETRFLRGNASWIAAQEWADELYREVREAWAALRSATGRGPDPILGWCGILVADGECGGPIRQVPGELALVCGRCKTKWETPEQRARGTLMMRSS